MYLCISFEGDLYCSLSICLLRNLDPPIQISILILIQLYSVIAALYNKKNEIQKKKRFHEGHTTVVLSIPFLLLLFLCDKNGPTEYKNRFHSAMI